LKKGRYEMGLAPLVLIWVESPGRKIMQGGRLIKTRVEGEVSSAYDRNYECNQPDENAHYRETEHAMAF